MNKKNSPITAAHPRIEDFGPMPTLRQQIVALAVAGAVMILICATASYLGLI